ncbi:MAG: hypothetical protein GTO02_13600 [Candidatus Dadabacteria bacterium]|nr:hypothetical protein [Candidatus Dadabacteria bacterium]
MATPIEDIDRINERLNRERGERIVDRDTYDLEFERLLETKQLTDNQKKLRIRAFRRYASRHKIREERLFKGAGGGNLRKDQQRTAKTVTEDPAEFEIKGARKIDFKGLDTQFVFRSTITRAGKKITVFRDAKGRFIKK